jgi:GTP 3',8-cyclase
MATKFIPIADARSLPLPQASESRAQAGSVLDVLNRPLHDLRISVTDRCNFRCSYCMPKEVFNNTYQYLPHAALLSFEEIVRTAQAFIALGVSKIRLTGGEPLLRKNIEHLIEMLSQLRTREGAPLDLTLTTNGSLLKKKAQALRDAGLSRLTVSLDALNETVFQRMNDVDFPVAEVLEGIEAARSTGFGKDFSEPIKINMVVKRGVNDHEILPMAQYFRGTGHALRFIEYMDVGSTNAWRMDEVLSSAQVRDLIAAVHPLQPVQFQLASATADRWEYVDGAGEVGFISSVTQAFCADCTRARLSTEGQLYLCLFGHQGYDLKQILRSGAVNSDEVLQNTIKQIWQGRADRYSLLRTQATGPDDGLNDRKRVEMSYIGG